MDSSSPVGSPLLSPAKARQQAIQAKDWAYVNSWLARRYSPKPVPHFERNEDTLRTLLALAAANETADEEATLLHRAREQGVRNFHAQEETEDKNKEELLDEVEFCLDESGARDLDDLAETKVTLGALTADTIDLAQSIIELTQEEFDAQDQVSNVGMLRGYLEKELATSKQRLERLNYDKAYEIPPDLPSLTAEWVRGAKVLAAKIGEYHDRIASLERNKLGGPTIKELELEEDEVIRFKESVMMLEGRVTAFHDLPKNVEGARSQYQQLERELGQLTQQRNRMFGLVGRE